MQKKLPEIIIVLVIAVLLSTSMLTVGVNNDTNYQTTNETSIEFPTSVGEMASWDASPIVPHYQNVDESPPDDSSTYVSTSDDEYELLGIDGTDMGGSIVSVTLHGRFAAGSDGSDSQEFVVYDGMNAPEHASPQTIYSAYPTFENHQYTYYTNPCTGSNWTWNELATYEFGAYSQTDFMGGTVYMTQFYVEIEYTSTEDDTWPNHKMHFPQYPDPNGWDVDFGILDTYNVLLGDDWQCSESGNVSGIHFWVSFYDDVTIPITEVDVSIWSDNPDGGSGYSEPLTMLWSEAFYEMDFTRSEAYTGDQGWIDPSYSSNTYEYHNHLNYYRIDIENITTPFYQENGTIYWLVIDMPQFPEIGGEKCGWKTSLDNWNDEAVWGFEDVGGESEIEPQFYNWWNLSDENGTGLDFAFVITSENVSGGGPDDPVTELYVNTSYDSGTPGWGSTHFATIQNAVDACTGGYNYTINVYPGTYNENVAVSTSNIHIKGNYTLHRPIVDGTSSTEPSILFDVSENCTLSGMEVRCTNAPSYSAVEIVNSDYFEMYDCYLTDCDWGFLSNPLGDPVSLYLDIYHNEFYDCAQYGMNIAGAISDDDQSEIYNNTIWGLGTENTAVGISIGGYITNTTVRNNYIHNCSGNGITVGLRSVDNYIYENQIENCGGDGVELGYECARNWIYHNNFISNPPDTHSTIFENYWNLSYPGCGNYYSGHGAQDSYWGVNQDMPGSDGICDSTSPDPYTINSPDNIDNYPFLNPYNGTNATPVSNLVPVIEDGSPNGTLTNTSPVLELTLSDNENDLLNASFYWSNHTFIGYDEGYTSASIELSPTILNHDQTYGWYANVTDGTSTVTGIFSFDTCKNYDLVPDGIINYLDVSSLVSHYLDSVSPAGSDPWDINNDGVVNYLDISTLVSNYGVSY